MKKVVLVFFLILSIATIYAEGKPITFSSDRMSGTAGKKTGSTVLEGNATVTVGTLCITGDRIELSGKNFRFITATGNVSGKDTEKGYGFSSDVMSYDRDIEVASFHGNAKLSDTKNDVESSASIIIYNQKTEVAFFQIDVKLKRKTIDCSSGFALYRRSLSLLDLTGAPKVIRDGDEFTADRITVNLDNEHITLDGSVSGTLKDSGKKDASGASAGEDKAGKDGKTSPVSASVTAPVSKDTAGDKEKEKSR